jgi:transcriptional regulator CtsR
MEIAKIVLEFIKAIIWPVTTLIIIAIFRQQIGGLFHRIRKAELPGGITLETLPEQLKVAKEISEEVKQESTEKIAEKKVSVIPLTETNKRMLNIGLAPSPSGLELSYYRTISDQDPNLALAGLRMEVETMLKNLAKGFKIEISNRESSRNILVKLKEKYCITSRQYELILKVLKLCNAAIHGLRVSTQDANEILDIATVLRDDYVAWLSWGFGD